jgi:hypothetical protein
MKGLIRGVVGAVVVLGATACADDYSIDFGGAPTAVQPSPEVMFLNSGTQKELLVRLVNDRNQSTPTSFQVTNVGAGLTVTYDDQYRPQWTSVNPVLEAPLVKEQQRYTVAADLPTGGKRTFQLTSSGLTGTATVYILPTSLGASLSNLAPALGETVTLNAPDGQSFTPPGGTATASTVSFPAGGAPIIQEITAKSITFIPRPGTTGAATVTGITLDYAPTLAPRSLTTSNAIEVEAIDEMAVTYSTASPALFAEVTVTAPTGFRFLPNFRMALGYGSGRTISVAADSKSAVVILPAGVSSTIPTFSNVVLSFLTGVPISNVPGVTPMTTPALPWVADDFDPGVRNITTAAAGTATVWYDSWINATGDCCGFGGGNKIYTMTQPTAGSRTYQLNWTQDAGGTYGNMSYGIVNEAITAFLLTALTSNRPETGTANLGAGNFWWISALTADANPPGVFWITIQ